LATSQKPQRASGFTFHIHTANAEYFSFLSILPIVFNLEIFVGSISSPRFCRYDSILYSFCVFSFDLCVAPIDSASIVVAFKLLTSYLAKIFWILVARQTASFAFVKVPQPGLSFIYSTVEGK
jgi:hypothetical protein